jgi:hypothetical protein
VSPFIALVAGGVALSPGGVALFPGGVAQAGVVQGSAGDLDAVYAPRRVAVVVGVEDYTDPALQGLRFPAKDARDLGAALIDPEIGAFDRVFVIEGAEATTREGIRNAIGVAAADLQRDDTFVLYLSGHGTLTLDPTEGSRLWFLPSDGALSDPNQTGVAIADLEDWVNGLPARRRVLIMDTCHNGRAASSGLAGRAALNVPTTQLLAGMRGEAPAPRGLREVSESEARLFAAQYHQAAMEDPELENGVYTHFLLQSLTGQRGAADLDRDGLVDVTEAHDYARDKTIAHTGGLQVPRAEYRIVGKEEIWLAGDPSTRKVAEFALLTGVDQVLASARILIDGIPRGPAVGLTAVEPGRREVELLADDGRTLVKRQVRFEAGSTLPVEDLFTGAPAHWAVLLGGAAVSGSGASAWHPWAGEVELLWIAPQRHDRLRWEVHARSTGAWGQTDDLVAAGLTSSTGGLAAAGVSVGLAFGGFSVGPTAELAVPWRSFEDAVGANQQGSVTAAAGGRGLYTAQLGRQSLVVRLDSRVVPQRYGGAWTTTWHQGLALGLTFR